MFLYLGLFSQSKRNGHAKPFFAHFLLPTNLNLSIPKHLKMSYSFVSNAHPAYIEGLYKQYQQDADSVPSGWKEFFLGFDYAQGGEAVASVSAGLSPKEFAVLGLIEGYRERGHLLSTTNPIRRRKHRFPQLNLSDYGLSEADLNQTFAAGAELGLPNASLSQIVERLQTIYGGNIGFEFNYIHNQDRKKWLQTKIEALQQGYGLSLEKKRRVLEKLNGAVGFEHFLAKRYQSQKRFGLEGGESMIPALDGIITQGAELGVKEVVIGMAHRGRLNVLANIMGKTYEYIFNEFEGVSPPDQSFGDGDVKYHLGYSSIGTTPLGKEVHLKLVPNPSHLEAVNPVVEGFARAKADLLYGGDFDAVLPILIHGDAAVAGQGIVYEVIQMSQLEGYYTGGTLHFVINNQVGFTTDFEDARSSTYCTSIAAVVQAPVFHVNGDDPEAVLFASELAAAYRQEFNADVFIDMVCYRRNGHNEGDDPQFTQPQLYKLIKNHADPRSIYVNQLIARGELEAEMAKQMDKAFDDFLQARLDQVRQKPLPYQYQEPEQAWRKLKKQTTAEDYEQSPASGIPVDQVKSILERLQTVPEGFTPLPKMDRLLKNARKLIEEGKADWAMAELLAYGSLLLEGRDVRMSGQDVKRGTFSHRNAVWYDVENNKQYNRLNNLAEEQGKFRIYNSLLSEFAVLGFEYGYAMASPDSLVLWEAQFGDFCNGAQTIIDQFITAGESKWQRMNGLVMLLPHGYEGQGPEHSSARMERFLQSSAEHNITVANVTTPANFFHLLRRQIVRPFRKPLVVMSPKSMLREELCVSSFEAFGPEQRFQELIDDADFSNSKQAQKVKKVLLCSGKIYYDLLKKKKAENRDDIAIVRLEQLYPLPMKQLEAVFSKYSKAELAWVQEEPANMGAWNYLLGFLRNTPLQVISRKPSASPATGFKALHDKEQANILNKAFALAEKPSKVLK
jgi:2-oxoglutarate dehydrogenase E1 component